MARHISQFMWGYQDTFRFNLESTAKQTLDGLGTYLVPKALLIGFRQGGTGEWPICIEPEDEIFHPDHLSQVLTEAEYRYKNHPLSQLHHSHLPLHNRIQATVQDKCLGATLDQTLSISDLSGDRIYFASTSTVVENFRIFPVVSVLKHKWIGLPSLQNPSSTMNRYSIIPSFQRCVIEEILQVANFNLAILRGPDYYPSSFTDESGRILQRAANDFINRITSNKADEFASDFALTLEGLAAQPYEGRTGLGTIILAKKTHPHLESNISFTRPISVKNIRAFRKVLEMTGPDLDILCDGKVIFGLGRVRAKYDPLTEAIFKVKILGKGTWELEHDSRGLLRVEFGRPKLPQERLSEAKFKDTVSRIFPSENNASGLWELSLEAAKQKNGTMLVVHLDASGEASRLAPQAFAIQPSKMTTNVLRTMTAIDGAVLLDPLANCHAVGVILDGLAVRGTGDQARGARFNSATRYLHAHKGNCLIIIVSEDGMIDLLPDLPRRILKADVEKAVVTLEELSEGNVNFKKFHEQATFAESLEIYMTPEQCERVNQSRERVEQVRGKKREGITRVVYRKLFRSSAPDESLFLPDENVLPNE